MASVPEDKDVRLLAGVAYLAGVTVCEDGIVMTGTVGTLSPSDSDGPVGTLSLSDSDYVGPDGTLSSSDLAGILFPAVPTGIPFPVGPVGPDGTLSSSDHAGILFSAVPAGIPFRAGPVGTLSPSDFGSVGPLGPVGTLSLSDRAGVLSPTVPVGEPSPVDPDDETPRGLVPAVWTEFLDGKDPVVAQLPAELPGWDPGSGVDVDMAMDVRQAVPNVIDRRAVVAMVSTISTTQMGEVALMDCDSDCVERHILNEFETVNGMPVYYGGDLYDTEWEDPGDLAYADWVDWCDFSDSEEYGVDFPDMEDTGLPKAVDVTVMMVGELASPGNEHQERSSYSLPAADMVITEPVAEVPVVTESQDHLNTFDPDLLNTFETLGGMPVYYGGDLNDSDFESVGYHGIMAFARIPKMHSRRLYSVPRCFGVRTWLRRHKSGRTFGMRLYQDCRLSPFQW